MDLKKLLQQSVDLHMHVGPEIIPRKFTIPDLIKAEKNNLKAIGVKNHFFPTVSMIDKKKLAKSKNFIVHSLVLNNYMGGFNVDIISASSQLSSLPIIVWFPTLHAENVLKQQQYEIPTEWIGSDSRKQFKKRPVNNVKGLCVLDNQGKLKSEVQNVLQAIKDCNAILATGHISWEESKTLVSVAIQKFGIKKVIVTHPIYQKINMPLIVQRELAALGAFMEQCFSMYAIDNVPMKKIAEQIKYVGANKCILTSDVGQAFSKKPSEALLQFVLLLEQQGVTRNEIKKMLVDNPGFLIKIE